VSCKQNCKRNRKHTHKRCKLERISKRIYKRTYKRIFKRIHKRSYKHACKRIFKRIYKRTCKHVCKRTCKRIFKCTRKWNAKRNAKRKTVPACRTLRGRGLHERGVSWSLAPVRLSGPDLCLSKWAYFTAHDPTNGLVQYVSHQMASSQGMVNVLPNGVAVLSVDNKTDLPLNTPRQSCVLSVKFVEVPLD
jgi:hypothetical protein